MRKIMTAGIIVISGLIAVAATTPDEKYTNLKVLPGNISSNELAKIMVDEFTDGLGVSCTYCHAEDKDTHKPDYASDEKPEKLAARKMMRMTLEMNKKYFEISHPAIGNAQMMVTCNTCHNGKPKP